MPRKRSRAFWGLVTVFILVAIGGALVIGLAELKLTRLVPGGLGESFSTRIFSAPYPLTSGKHYLAESIVYRLERVAYRSSSAPQLKPGEFHWDAPTLTIYLRGFQTPVFYQVAGLYRLTRQGDDRLVVMDEKNQPVDEVFIEPELAAELSGPNKVRRDPAAWEEFPPSLLKAVVAVEDKRFYGHHGIDFRSIARAAAFNLKNRKKLQGGSTITQQLAKNLFLTHKRTLRRKVVEAALAVYLDFRYSKEKILTLYLNQIYMGQDGFVSVAGMKAAASFYFGKPLKDLTLPESATLAGVIRSPYRYNPVQNPDAAWQRRNLVIGLMEDQGLITKEEAEAAQVAPLGKQPRRQNPGLAADNDYFVAEVVRRIIPRYSEDMLYRYGLKIYTTLDPVMQKAAQSAVRHNSHQAAIVSMDPMTGRILALVGGKSYRESQFNRASQAHRQPGSAFKPFVYGAALESGLTPATLLKDEPRAYTDGSRIWAPQNFDRVYHGEVPLRQALAASLNGATLDLAERIGTGAIIRFARKLGIESPLDRSLAVALGASEVTPIELTTAYAPFANGGFLVEPYLVTAVFDAQDNLLELAAPVRTPVLDPAQAYLMTSLLETTVKGGTAQGLAGMGFHYPAAGKTGTTNEGRDAWFVGYTTEFLTGVWIGEDGGKGVNITGARYALPVWASVMKAVSSPNLAPFLQPSGVVTARIDPASGLLARSGCPARVDEMFVAGTEPTRDCMLHAGGLKGFIQRLFKKKAEGAPPKQPTD